MKLRRGLTRGRDVVGPVASPGSRAGGPPLMSRCRPDQVSPRRWVFDLSGRRSVGPCRLPARARARQPHLCLTKEICTCASAWEWLFLPAEDLGQGSQRSRSRQPDGSALSHAGRRRPDRLSEDSWPSLRCATADETCGQGHTKGRDSLGSLATGQQASRRRSASGCRPCRRYRR
jgi:hypothetical protein